MSKIIKGILIGLLALVLTAELLMLVTGNWYLNTVFALTIFSGKTGPSIDEVDLFENHKVPTIHPQPWATAVNYNKPVIAGDLAAKMEFYQTVSFVVIKNDSVLYEKYWSGYADTSLVNSFSMAKSITGILIGCAIRDGLIKSVDDPVHLYIEKFKEGDLSFITIKHLLTMSSGLDFKEDYVSPLAWPAEAYYGPDVNELTLAQSQPLVPPGKIWQYKGGDSQLLGIILKKVTGKTVAQYAAEKLWIPLGAERDAFWSLDKKGMEKVSCCWYTNAKDFARVARLMMHSGNWNGQQILDSSYVKEAITAAELLGNDGKPSREYGYQWWITRYREHDIFYARGIRGQYIFAIPDLDLIVVRLGHKRSSILVNNLPEDIYVYLDAAMAMN